MDAGCRGGSHTATRPGPRSPASAPAGAPQAKPRAFLFENVDGLLEGPARPYFLDEVVPAFERLGYDVDHRLLLAADYGVPQRRPRVFTAGFRRSLGVDWKTFWPAPTHSEGALLVAQWVDGSYWKEHGVPAPEVPTELVERLDRMRPPPLARWRTVRDAVGPGGPYVPPPPRRGDYKAVPSTWDLPAHTITTWQDSTVLLTDDAGGHRYMTIPELMRLQTFPPTWRLAGPAGDSLRQIGNAVAADMGRVVMAAVARALA